jgi:hypothetical protein
MFSLEDIRTAASIWSLIVMLGVLIFIFWMWQVKKNEDKDDSEDDKG